MRAVALIPAAGSGERLGYRNFDGSSMPKALVPCAGRPLLAWSLLAFDRVEAIAQVVVAAPSDWLGQFEDAVGELELVKPLAIVAGGASRAESVRNALAAAELRAAKLGAGDLVAVHDAARPLVAPDLIERCIAAAGAARIAGAIAAAPVTDTIKLAAADETVHSTLDRSRLWSAQTPQVFKLDQLQRALDLPREALAGATDDSVLVERNGGSVAIVSHNQLNLKVTTRADLDIAQGQLGAGRSPK